MVMFDSYVKLPEGKCPLSRGFTHGPWLPRGDPWAPPWATARHQIVHREVNTAAIVQDLWLGAVSGNKDFPLRVSVILYVPPK